MEGKTKSVNAFNVFVYKEVILMEAIRMGVKFSSFYICVKSYFIYLLLNIVKSYNNWYIKTFYILLPVFQSRLYQCRENIYFYLKL